MENKNLKPFVGIKGAGPKPLGVIERITILMALLIAPNYAFAGFLTDAPSTAKTIIIGIVGLVLAAFALIGLISIGKSLIGFSKNSQEDNETTGAKFKRLAIGLVMVGLAAFIAIALNDFGVAATTNSAMDSNIFGS